MSFSIEFSTNAAKELEKLDTAVQIQLLKKIAHLKGNSFLGEPLSNVMKNNRRLHVGKWRVVYSIEQKENLILIAKIGHRKDVYE